MLTAKEISEITEDLRAIKKMVIKALIIGIQNDVRLSNIICEPNYSDIEYKKCALYINLRSKYRILINKISDCMKELKEINEIQREILNLSKDK